MKREKRFRSASWIYPMQNKYVGYFIRDYWIEMDFDENKVEVGAYYLPERQ